MLCKKDLILLAGKGKFWEDKIQSLPYNNEGQSINSHVVVEQLTKNICDIYPSYDWGRDFGIDNRVRVESILQHLSHDSHYQIFQSDYIATPVENQLNINRCRHVIVFLTDRYVRRVSERGFLHDDFNYCLNRSRSISANATNADDDLPMVMIVAIMEERVSRKKESYLKMLGISSEIINTPMCVDVWDLKTDAVVHAQRIHAAIVQTGLYFHQISQRQNTNHAIDVRIPLHSLNDFIIAIYSFCAKSLLKAIEDEDVEVMTEQLSLCDRHTRVYHFPYSVACGGSNENSVSVYLLHRIIEKNNLPLLEAFLAHVIAQSDDHQSVLDVMNARGQSALHIACQCAQVGNTTIMKIIELLLQFKSKVNVVDNLGFTPLHYAIQHDNFALVSLLIHYKADVFTKTKNGDSDIDLAISPKMQEFLRKIHSCKQAILLACQQRDLETVKQLLTASKVSRISMEEGIEVDLEVDVNICNEDGRSSLYFAATHDKSEDIVELLLQVGKADPDIVDNWGTSPLCEAAMMHDNAKVIQLLLAAGASIEKANCYGNTALMNGSQGGNYPMVEALITAGAQVNLTSSRYYKTGMPFTPIEAAFEEGHLHIVQLLLYRGAKVSSALLDHLIALHTISHDELQGTDSIPSTTGNLHVSLKLEVLNQFATTWSHARLRGDQTIFSFEALSAHKFALWFAIIQLESSDSNRAILIETLIVALAKQYPNLIHAKDMLGRSANIVATARYRAAMNSLFLWHGRYRPASMKKEHCSATSFVYRAYDEQSIVTSNTEVQNEDMIVQEPVQVAIKCFRYKMHFLRELELRRQYVLDSKFVVNSDRHFFPKKKVSEHSSAGHCDNEHYTERDGPDDCFEAIFPKAASGLTLDRDWQKHEIEQMYAIVMPFCDRNMFVAIKQERFAGNGVNNSNGSIDADSRGSDQEQVKAIFKQIIFAVDHLHRKGIVHGDLKPLNIMRHDSRWKLIDLDASGRIQYDVLLQKYSSAFVPPEALTEVQVMQQNSGSEQTTSTNTSKVVVVRSSQVKKWLKEIQNLNPDEEPSFMLRAQPSFDIWSLGVILYQLCSQDAVSLFQAGQDDNLLSNDENDAVDEDLQRDSLRSLWRWSDQTKKRKLALIPDPMARNLISLMLMKDPIRRPTISRILAHPFLSGNTKNLARSSSTEIGDSYDAPEFDCFLSYRVATDLQLVEVVYEMLTKRGFKVWWDKQCLPLGKDWQQSFCEGLMKSRSYICFLSKAGINHPTNPRQSFAFEHTRHCDNLLLEIRLALELHRLGYVETLVPVFVGDVNFDEAGQIIAIQKFDFAIDSPKVPNVVIDAIEDALRREMNNQCLGESVLATNNRETITVQGLWRELNKYQGVLTTGTLVEAAKTVADRFSDAHKVTESSRATDNIDKSTPRSHNHVNSIRGLKDWGSSVVKSNS